jgi:hypothetical protein
MDSPLNYNTILDITTKEEYLPFVRVAVLVKRPQTDILQTYGLNTGHGEYEEYNEFASNYYSIAFKHLSTNANNNIKTYRIYISLSFYVHTDDSKAGYGNPLDITANFYYLNEKGSYEIRKLSI